MTDLSKPSQLHCDFLALTWPNLRSLLNMKVHDRQLRQRSTEFRFAADGTTNLHLDDSEDLLCAQWPRHHQTGPLIYLESRYVASRRNGFARRGPAPRVESRAERGTPSHGSPRYPPVRFATV